VRHIPEFRGGCDDLVETANPGRFTRRPLLRAAVFGQRDADGQREAAQEYAAAYESLLRPRPAALRTVITGVVSDVSPHVLILHTSDGEERLTMTPATVTWRGAHVAPTGLRQGDHVIVRKTALPFLTLGKPGAVRRTIVDRVWAGIGRTTGTIVEAKPSGPRPGMGAPRGLELLVDEGPGKARKIVVISRETYRQILVRFPRLEPGYLIDVIGLRRDGCLQALSPATSQPAYRADHPPAAPPLASGHVPNPVSGAAVWHEPGDEPASLLGLAYPALDPETGCEVARPASHAESHAVDPHVVGPGCVRLPYLSIGSVVVVGNDCSGLSAPLPITSCGASARLFCDRCVECSTSPRGRIADLTMSAFVELGGWLENGCFNASLTMPG
jgi:hypothetical protein